MVVQATYAIAGVSSMNFRDLEDVDVLALVAIGHRDALEALYDKYSTPVFSLTVNMLRDKETAEEITQDVFLNVWRYSSTYRPDRGSVSAWIFGIAHNRAIDELRRRRRQGPKVDIEDENMERYFLPSTAETDPLSNASLNEERQHIRKALKSLSPEQRDVVLLSYFKGYTHSEIAERLRQPLGTVKTRMRLAMKKLREVLVIKD